MVCGLNMGNILGNFIVLKIIFKYSYCIVGMQENSLDFWIKYCSYQWLQL